ncbi:F-box DNA helicase 1-like [Vipera latastei]
MNPVAKHPNFDQVNKAPSRDAPITWQKAAKSKLRNLWRTSFVDSSSTPDDSSIRPGDGEDTSVPPRKRSRLSQGPSDSGRSSDQEVEPALVRPPERNVDDGTFGVWKEVYHQYLEGDSQTLLTVRDILQRYGLTQNHTRCVPGLIRCVAAVRSCHCENPSAILTCLEGHSLFPHAEICIANNFPDLESCKENAAYVRAVMAAIVLFAGGVWDVQELVACLRRPTPPMTLMDINEMLYCTATLLYAMRENGVQISNRFYYNVFYYLRTVENSPARDINPELQDSSPDLQPTDEQQQILNHTLTPGEVVKIVAFAGTGKTYTLIQYAKKWSKLKFLYVVFNRSVQKQVEQLFLRNVTARTFHSLAYEAAKTAHGRGLQLLPLTSYVTNFFQSNRQHKPRFIRIKMIAETLAVFFASADESVTVDHMPEWCTDIFEKCDNYVFSAQELCQIIVDDAKEIWNKMRTLSPAGQITHDGYLKLWQLQKPSLSDYDVILVDEAQDCTPAMLDIVRSQTCSVILVGDPHQKIYSFRGADNAVFNMPHSRIFYLTQSFRFGFEIAYVAATILDVSRNVRKKTLVGNKKKSDVRGVGVEGQVARLSRTNKTVFEDAVNLTSGDAPAQIHVLGGLEAFGLGKIRDIYALLHPELELEIQDPFIRDWENEGFARFKVYAEKAEEEELKSKIVIVENARSSIPDLLQKISQCHVLAPEHADYILGTVHKAKGLEFDTVQVAEDFVSIKHQLGSPGIESKAASEDEWNLLYVAVTRAKRRLILPGYFAALLEKAKEYCVRFELLDRATALACLENGCRNTILADSFLVPRRVKFVYLDGTEIQGLLCPSCAAQILGPIAQLAGSPRIMLDAANPPEAIEVPAALRHLLEDL